VTKTHSNRHNTKDPGLTFYILTHMRLKKFAPCTKIATSRDSWLRPTGGESYFDTVTPRLHDLANIKQTLNKHRANVKQTSSN